MPKNQREDEAKPLPATPAWGSPEDIEAFGRLPAAIERERLLQEANSRAMWGAASEAALGDALPRPAPAEQPLRAENLVACSGRSLGEGVSCSRPLPDLGGWRGWGASAPVGRASVVETLNVLARHAPEECAAMIQGINWSDGWVIERGSVLGGVHRQEGSLLSDLAAFGSDEVLRLALERAPAAQWKSAGFSRREEDRAAALFAAHGRAEAMDRVMGLTGEWDEVIASPYGGIWRRERSPFLALARHRAPLAAQAQTLARFESAREEGEAKNKKGFGERANQRVAAWKKINPRKKWSTPLSEIGLGHFEETLGETLGDAIDAGNRGFVALSALAGVPQEVLSGNVRENQTLADIAFRRRSIWSLEWLKGQGVSLADSHSADWAAQWARDWERWAETVDAKRAAGWAALEEGAGSFPSQRWLALESWRSAIDEGLALARMVPFVQEAGHRWGIAASMEPVWNQLEAFVLAQDQLERRPQAAASSAAPRRRL